MVKIVADFSWIEYTVNATATSVPTNLNLGSSTGANIAPSTYPITAGTYSYAKWIRGWWGNSFTRIENLKMWCSASGTGYVTGEIINFSGTTTSYAGTSVYVTPTASSEAKCVQAMIFSAPASANIGFTGSLTASLTATGMCDFIVLQASITTAASAGATQQKTFTLQYDEV